MMIGIYINNAGEIVYAGRRKPMDPPGQVWHDLPRDYWPPGDLIQNGHYAWQFVDGRVKPANVDARKAVKARLERNQRLSALDDTERQLTRKLRIARRTGKGVFEAEAALADLDNVKEALCDLPDTDGNWPYITDWPTYK